MYLVRTFQIIKYQVIQRVSAFNFTLSIWISQDETGKSEQPCVRLPFILDEKAKPVDSLIKNLPNTSTLPGIRLWFFLVSPLSFPLH
jgi:hypothetical protein